MRPEQLLFPAIQKLLRHLGAGGTATWLPGVRAQADLFPQLAADWGQAFHNMDCVA